MSTKTNIRWLMGIACVCGFTAAAGAAQVIYVDATAGGDGSSWTSACLYLQDALTKAAGMAKPVEIRVAQGVHQPDQGAGKTPGDSLATFQLLNGVTLKGGYAGAAAADPNARDVELYETILSGDLAGDDGPKGLYWQDNSCHVVTASGADGTAVIDGFTITAGCSSSSKCGKPARGGSGMLIDAGSPRVLHCRFARNGPGGRGGALLVDNGSAPTLTSCTFLNNEAAGLNSEGDSSPVLTNCRFEGHTPYAFDNHGGNPALTNCSFVDNGSHAIFTSSCDLVLTGCVFERNRRAVSCWSGNLTMIDCTLTGHTSAGVEVMTGSDLKLLGCTFTGNRGRGSELVRCWGFLTARYCVFRDNTGWLTGVAEGGNMELSDCEFTGNSGLWTGVLDAMGDRLMVTRCLFAGNTGNHSVISAWAAFTRFSNCTFVDNRSEYGVFGHLLGAPRVPVELTDCIIWNGPDSFRQTLGRPSRLTIRYSDVQGGYPGAGNIDVDPCFVAPGYWGDPNDPHIVRSAADMNAVWVGGDYHLKSQAGHWDSATERWVRDEVTSPCIDAGDPNWPIGIEPFPNGGWLNLGAYGGSAQASKSYFGEPVCETQIPGDINGDCKVDATDQAILQAHWLMEGTMFVNTPPTVKMTSPEDGAELRYGTRASLRAEATDADGTVLIVHFYMQYRRDNSTSTMGTSDANGVDGWGCELDWQNLSAPDGATLTVWAKAMDDDGATTTSPPITITCRRETLGPTPPAPAR